ncbi:MAG: signal peptidase I [Clostridia bacterium]|nr:signal peptidase I [Clostridia bacterium]
MKNDLEKNISIEKQTEAPAERDESPARIDRRRESAFEKAAERLHKKHSELNRTFTPSFIAMLACVIVAAVAIRQFIAEPTRVKGESMQYTLMDTERLFVEKVSYWFNAPSRGDIVIVNYPGGTDRYVKRIIALPGETIEIREDGFVYINGEMLDESAYAGDWYGKINIPIGTKGSKNGKYTVPEGHYFVMGDNRNDSTDSRDRRVGAIPVSEVLGRVRAVVWPLNKLRSAD